MEIQDQIYKDVLSWFLQRCKQGKDRPKKLLTEPNSLRVPDSRWGSVGTDFITDIPMTKNGFDTITTWVDLLERRVHFITSKVKDSAADIKNDFFDHILNDLPDYIVSDRYPKFTSSFWTYFLDRCGVKMWMSNNSHPQIDRASEVLNRMVENYLRFYYYFKQTDWYVHMTAADFAYNSAKCEDLVMTEFELDIGWTPMSPLDVLSQG